MFNKIKVTITNGITAMFICYVLIGSLSINDRTCNMRNVSGCPTGFKQIMLLKKELHRTEEIQIARKI
jgi:hypothetical protein